MTSPIGTAFAWTATGALDRVIREYPSDDLAERTGVPVDAATFDGYAAGELVWNAVSWAFDPVPVDVNADLLAAAALQDTAAQAAAPGTVAQEIMSVVYDVHRIETAWGHAIEGEVLRGYSVVGQLALRTFDPWDGAIPFADVDGRLIATVVGVGTPEPGEWVYGIWVEGIPLDEQTLPADVATQAWLATRLIVDGVPTGGGSVPIEEDIPTAEWARPRVLDWLHIHGANVTTSGLSDSELLDLVRDILDIP